MKKSYGGGKNILLIFADKMETHQHSQNPISTIKEFKNKNLRTNR